MTALVPIRETQALIQYEEARRLVERCAKVDEAATIADKAAQLAAYYRQSDDPEFEGWMRDIQIRAVEKCGELSRDLDKAEPHGRGPVSLPSGGKRKSEVLADAGISTSAAHRAEQLAGGPTKNGQRAAGLALDGYLAGARKAGRIPSLREARVAVREAVARVEPPKPKPAAKASEEYRLWLRNTAAVRDVADLDTSTFPVMLAQSHRLKLMPTMLAEARRAHANSAQWLALLEDQS